MSKSKIVRATAEVKHVANRNKPGHSHGFQTCRLIDEDGGYQEFTQYFDPAKGAFAMEPGDYALGFSEPRVKDERLTIYPEFVAIKAASKAA